MFTREQLSERIRAYVAERLSFVEFEDWFEAHSTGAYAVPELRDLYADVDAALSEYHFDSIGEAGLRDRLLRLAGLLDAPRIRAWSSVSPALVNREDRPISSSCPELLQLTA